MNWLTRKTTEKVQGRAMIYLLLSFCLLFSFLSPLSAKVLVSGEKKNVSEKSRALLPKPVKEAIKSQDKTRGDKKYKIAFGSDEVEIGDSASRKFKPQVKIKRWGEEAYLNVEVDQSNLVSQNDSVNLQADRVGWDSSKVGAGFYKTGARTVKVKDRKNKERALSLSPNGGFEFEVVLYERPQSNVISLPIQSKGLKFYYQKPLTDTEKAQGIIRPDEVSGSYAVYHESKKDGKYNTGKAFQIYRPKIVDANGKWVWGELNIDAQASALKITIDDSWLDTAAYPVVVDPEFGYTSIGASAISLEDTLRGTIFTASVFAPSAITAYLENTDASVAHNAKFAIYKISDGQLVDSTQEVSIPASGKGWYDASYLNSFTLSAQQYALVANGDNSNILIYFDDGEPSSGQSLSKSKTYSLGWSDTLTEPSYDDKIYSICGSTGAQISITVTLDTTAPTNQDEVFTESVTKKGGDAVTVVSSGDATNNIWFAPAGTTTFTAGETKTTAGGTATSILAPATEGAYKLYVIDAVGNVSNPSTATLTVDNTPPANLPPCGESFTITHAAGSVAPVTKTVTYGTVATTLSGTNACWITKNLGADQQATSDDDHGEASRGWFWQFNRKQGYNVADPYPYTYTPSVTGQFMVLDNDESDWSSVNDPCTLLIGPEWRIPTKEEWSNVVSSSGWDDNGFGTLTAILKLNFAGYIEKNDNSGYLTNTTQANYWSSTQSLSAGDGIVPWKLSLLNEAQMYGHNSVSVYGSINRRLGASIRCLSSTAIVTVFAESVVKRGEAEVTVNSSGDATNTIWFAPLGTTVFSTGKNMRMASGTATSIQAPEDEGEYKLYILDAAGNVSVPSNATLTVDNTAPTNQDVVFSADAFKRGGIAITISSSEDATNIIWFLPENIEGLTEIVPGPTITTATGTATSISAPGTEGRYKLYVQDQAGNMSAASTATLTVDNTAPNNSSADTCGTSFVKNHTTANGVAPLDKSITYGTVTSSLSGESKCWITQNLGADRSAISISGGDSAETVMPSMGWFWWYNNKQGHEVLLDAEGNPSISPVWPEFTGYSAASDWLPANDPCTIEFGIGWRLPTNTEWSNVAGFNSLAYQLVAAADGFANVQDSHVYIFTYVVKDSVKIYTQFGSDRLPTNSGNVQVNLSWFYPGASDGYFVVMEEQGGVSSYHGLDVGTATTLSVKNFTDASWSSGTYAEVMPNIGSFTPQAVVSTDGSFNSQSFDFEILAYNTVDSTKIYSPIDFSGSSTWVGDWSGSNFQLNLSWTYSGPKEGYYLLIYDNNTSTYYGKDVGAVTSKVVNNFDDGWVSGNHSAAGPIATPNLFDSALKLHYGGVIYPEDEENPANGMTIYAPTVLGGYWSSSQFSEEGMNGGYGLVMSDDAGTYYSETTGLPEFLGGSVRCLRDSVVPVFDADATVKGGDTVSINSSGDATNILWFAPSGTTSFAAGATMTTAGGTATSILAPLNEGTYKMYIVDAAGNVSAESEATLTVDNTAPTDQDTVFPESVFKKGDVDVTIVISEDATNNIWFAPAGTTTFAASATMTTAVGTATTIKSPANDGDYKLYVIDAVGNVSAPSIATLTVDNTAPTNQDIVFSANIIKKGGDSVTIVSSEDATNNVWFAPVGTTVFLENSIMTKAASGTATTILAPLSEWITYGTAGTTLTSGNTYANLYLNPSGALYNGDLRVVWLRSPSDVAWSIASGPASALGVTTSADTSIIVIQSWAPGSSDLYLYLSSDISEGDESISKGWYLITAEGETSVLTYEQLPNFSGFTIWAESDDSLINEVLADAPWAATINGYKLYIIDATGNISNPSTATLTVDNTAPTVTAVSSTLANGTYRTGQVIPITVTFDEAVTVIGTPQLSLATTYPATTAIDYVSGSGTNTLTFNYTVALGNESADLDYSGTDALALNGGTIKDMVGNNATLTLAAPGATGSLGANKAIVITREFMVTYTVKDSVIGSILSAVNLKIYNNSGSIVYNQTKDGVFDDIVLDYAAAGYVFQTTKDAYVSKSETKIPTSLEDVVDGTTDNTIHWTGYMTSLVEASADYQVKSSFTYIEPTYESDGTTLKSGTDVLNIKLWLERRGKMITNTTENLVGDATVEIYNDATGEWSTLTFNSATDPGQNNDAALAESARVGFFQKSIPYITTAGTPKLLTLEAGKTYFARCKIPWGGTSAAADTRYTYQGGTTFTITVSEKLKEVTDAIKTQILNTQTLVSSEAATTRSAVTAAGAAIESKVGTEADSIRESVAGVKAETAKILTATGTEGLSTKIDEIKTQVVDQVKPFVKSGIINRESSVKIGSAVTIRYRTETGLAPKLNVYSPADVLLVTSKAMTEVGTTGIYEASVTFLEAWGTGDFSVVCSESTKGTVDATVISVKDVDISDVSGNVSAVLGSTTGLTGMNKIVGDMSTKFTDMDKLLSKISTDMAGKLGDTKTAANDMLAAFKQIEEISKQIKEIGGGTGVNLEKLYAVSQDKKNDITYIKNKSEELKAAMELNQKLMQGVANKPVVETWFEYK